MPQNRTTKFMEAVVFSLYSYASNRREAYLLLQLFKTALQEEVKYVLLCRSKGGDGDAGSENGSRGTFFSSTHGKSVRQRWSSMVGCGLT